MTTDALPTFDELVELVEACSRRGWEPRLLRHLLRTGGVPDAAADALLTGDRAGFDGRFRHLGPLVRARLPARSLPGLPDGHTGAPQASKVTDKIRGLLAKAESTTFPDEAEALVAKAQELMTRYAIEQAAVERGREAAAVGVRHVLLDDPYMRAKYVLLTGVASANRCRAVLTQGYGISTVFGSPSDLDAVEVLFTSLLTQATSAMLAHPSRGTPGRTRSFRHAFLIAFAARIGQRLRDATAEAVAAAADPSLLPVLAARADAADDALQAAFPHLRGLSVSASDGAGLTAGRAAGDRAALSSMPLPTARTGLPRPA